MKDLDREAPPVTEEPTEGGGDISGACITVPKGEYELRYLDYETKLYFGNPKVILHCAIIEPDEYAGTPVDRYYNVKRLKGPTRRFGNYVASARGDLIREYIQLIGEPERLGKISFCSLRNKRLIGELETVTRNHHHNDLSENVQYSVIRRLVRIIPDDDW